MTYTSERHSGLETEHHYRYHNYIITKICNNITVDSKVGKHLSTRHLYINSLKLETYFLYK